MSKLTKPEKILLTMALGETKKAWEKSHRIKLEALISLMNHLELLNIEEYTEEDFSEYGEYLFKAIDVA